MTRDRERFSMESNTWAIGDSRVVQPGVTDPATGIAFSGWRGRLIALEDAEDRLSIQWDSLTLKGYASHWAAFVVHGA